MESCDKINKSHTDVTPPAVHVGVKQIGSFYPKNNKAARSGKSRLNMEATAGGREPSRCCTCSTSVNSSRSQIPQHCSNACKAGDGFASSDA